MGQNSTDAVSAYELLRNYIQEGDALSLKEQLLKCKEGVDWTDKNGNTPLLQAAFLGRSDCVKLLMEIGQSNYKIINVFGQNALTLASHAGCIDCVKLLLAKWSYKDYTETSVLPPLCVAAMGGHLEIVNLFCQQRSPDPRSIQSAHGVSPLHLAMTNGHTDVVQRLSKEFTQGTMQRKIVSSEKQLKSVSTPWSRQ